MESTEPPVKRRMTGKTAPCSTYPLEFGGPEDMERAGGERCRKQVSDQGMGHGQREMKKRLYMRGHDARQRACRDWLQRLTAAIEKA